MKKIKEGRYCEKNALICYTYNDGIQEDDYYTPITGNIGDYIQSLAASQFFPKVDEYIDRDQLGIYNGQPVNMIMNAWYRLWRKNYVFSDKINPLFVSVHLNQVKDIPESTISYLKKHEPIGCRDYATQDFLLSKGVNAYFTGCMTLTLGNTYHSNKKDKVIYFVDYQIKDESEINQKIVDILQEYKGYSIRYLSHAYPLSKDVKYSFNEAENLLKTYAKASLVFTRNIHVALPCLSMRVPVILLVPYYDKERFKGLLSLLNHIGYDENGKFIFNVNRDVNNNIINSDAYRKYADFLTQICLAYTKQEKFIPKNIDWENTSISQQGNRMWNILKKKNIMTYFKYKIMLFLSFGKKRKKYLSKINSIHINQELFNRLTAFH